VEIQKNNFICVHIVEETQKLTDLCNGDVYFELCLEMTQNAHTEKRFKDVLNSSSFRGERRGCHWAVEGDTAKSGTYQTSVL